MLAEDVKVSLRYDEGLSNRQAHHNLAVSAVGLILGDEFLVRRALGSLRYQLKHAVLGDGQWWECSPGYHFYAVRTLREVAQTFQRVGIDAARDPKLRLAFDAPLRFLLPDGTFPAVNDSHMGHKLSRSDFEFLYHYHRDPVYAGILSAPGYKREAGANYLFYGDRLGEAAPMPQDSWSFFQSGMAVLKPGGGLCAVMDYGHTVAGPRPHGQAQPDPLRERPHAAAGHRHAQLLLPGLSLLGPADAEPQHGRGRQALAEAGARPAHALRRPRTDSGGAGHRGRGPTLGST